MKYLERVNYKGFIWPLSWLTVLASLGNRVAYLMIKRFCKKSIGIGYAITGLELIMGALTPSNSARTGVLLGQ